MPIYEYRCKGCGHQFEDLRPAAEADLKDHCPKCGKPVVERIMSVFCSGSGGGGGGGSSSCGSGPIR